MKVRVTRHTPGDVVVTVAVLWLDRSGLVRLEEQLEELLLLAEAEDDQRVQRLVCRG
jgi:hypothetical protein